MKIGYIGLGNMGAPMVANLLAAKCSVTVFDIHSEKAAAAAANGATVAASGESLAANVDVLFTSLPQPEDVRQALPPLLQAMPTNSIWVDLTTNDRDIVQELARQASARGVGTVEAPLTGAVDGARRGTLTFFVGGDNAHVDRVRPLLEIMGTPIHCGALGNGNVVKLITNQMWFINAAAIGEALLLGKKAGVELPVLWEALKNSVGDSFVTRHDVPSIFAGHYDPSFALALCCKDLRLLTQLGNETKTPMDFTQLARDKFETARKTHGDDAAELLVCKLLEEQAGTDLRVEGNWVKHWEV